MVQFVVVLLFAYEPAGLVQLRPDGAEYAVPALTNRAMEPPTLPESGMPDLVSATDGVKVTAPAWITLSASAHAMSGAVLSMPTFCVAEVATLPTRSVSTKRSV